MDQMASLDPEERMACPCTQCKYQIFQKRRICTAHVREYGAFASDRLQNLRFQSHGSASEQIDPHEIAPSTSRGQKRTTWDTEGQTIRSIPKNEHMEAMLEAFHDMDEDNDGGQTVGGSMNTTEFPRSEADKDHQNMRKLARLPLYNGAKISVLRASLAMLNLQSIYGWSDASVSELFRYSDIDTFIAATK